jgi:hypothetical protein
MTKIVSMGVLTLVVLEVLLVTGPMREWLLAAGGVVAGVVLLVMRSRLSTDPRATVLPVVDRAAEEALERWRARTAIQISWADGSRGDWDRHLRPVLARDFQLALGRRFDRGVSGLGSAGRMVFGDDLWPWVDPSAVAMTDRDRPGPGRGVLAAILERLERL